MTDTDQLTTTAGGADPDRGLKAVHALRILVERLEALQVDNARNLGWSWQQIADRLGVTRQAVHRKYARGRIFSKEK
ncbi:MAG: AsnC family protein [Cumulibacter sp.]